MPTIAEYKAALSECGGDFALTANRLKVSYQAVHQRVGGSKDLQAWCDEVEKKIIGAAKGVLIHAIVTKKSERWSAWWLERKDRTNFSTRAELTGANGAPIAMAQKVDVTVTYVDASPGADEDLEIPI